jgi:hypothetical protein
MLVFQRLGVGQHQAQEDPLDRLQAFARAGAQRTLHQVPAVRVIGIHPGGSAIHVARELVEQDDQGHQQARVLGVESPVVVLPLGRPHHFCAEAVPDLAIGLL